MTNIEMLREFKVGIDKIDSSSYPEIYDEQIFMFINRFIISLVNAGRKVFEEDQVITDNLKALLSPPVKLTPTIDSDDSSLFLVDLTGLDYFFYIKSYAVTRISSDLKGRASIKVTQHDDIDTILRDPFNKPKSYKVPITFSRDSITVYTDGTFSVEEFWLTYIKKPAVVDANTNCDLDEQLHYTIVEGAIELAKVTLGINTQELNKQ